MEGGQRSAWTWVIRGFLNYSHYFSAQAFLGHVTIFHRYNIANGTQTQVRGSMSNFLHIGQNVEQFLEVRDGPCMVFLWRMIPQASGQLCKALACSDPARTTTVLLGGC